MSFLRPDKRHEIVRFEVIPCSIKYDPDKMEKLHMYDGIEPTSCPSNNKAGQQERVSFARELELEFEFHLGCWNSL